LKKDCKTQILLAEDDVNVLLSLEFILKSQGYAVETAVNGREALEKIQASRPEIAILDVTMPELNGFEVSREIKKRLGFSVYVILLTARSSDEDRRTGEESGVDEYLLKPYNPDKLLESIEKQIKKT